MVKTDRLTKNDENRLTLSFDSAQKSAETDTHTDGFHRYIVVRYQKYFKKWT